MIFITGVSRGFGKAIAELYLSKGEKVTGIGRSSRIENENFSFIPCDLSDLEAIQTINFDQIMLASSEPVTLINNAGIIGEIKRLSDKDNFDLERVLTVNTSAPMLLAQLIYNKTKNKDSFTLVNISSGAANRAIPSWASYCASKAALNMLTETFLLEEIEKGNHPKVLAVAPGVIDTGMQDQIRATNPDDFSALANFQTLKKENQLFSPEEAARRLFQLIHSEKITGVFHDLRAISDQ